MRCSASRCSSPIAQGEAEANTNWPIKLSFPVFVANLLQYFGRNRQAAAGAGNRVGQPVAL